MMFGDAQLGDQRRTQRLVRMGAQMAARPGGKVTEVFTEPAAREAAFRLLENDDVEPAAVADAIHQATARGCFGEPFVFVPVDGSSLNLADATGAKGLGAVGARAKNARGLCVMSAIAVKRDGTPVGTCGQAYWARPVRAAHRRRKTETRPVMERETRYWLEVMAQTRAAFEAEARDTRPWFQLDRGGDAWPVLFAATRLQQLVTVRATHDRRLCVEVKGQRHHLWAEVTRQPPLGRHTLVVPPGPGRAGRTAVMEIRACSVCLDLQAVPSTLHFETPVWAVHVREVDTTPTGEPPIEWMLLTTYPVTDLAAAQLVIFAYAQRWRIEEFHKIWKSGACRVEETQLREGERIEKWATMQAAVAMRILRLTYLARTAPATPATAVFTVGEVQAALVATHQPLKKPRGGAHTVVEIRDAVARLGGYTGKSSGGPPGALVIARGLCRMELLAQVIDAGMVKL
jgi:hypothetical protein